MGQKRRTKELNKAKANSSLRIQHISLWFHLFYSLEDVALGCDGHSKVVVVFPVLEEAPVLLVLPRLLRVGDGEEVVLAHEPVPQAAVLDHPVERPRHSLALAVSDVELLVGDEELRSDVLAGVHLLLAVAALAREGEAVLVGEVEDALQGRAAVDGRVVLREEGDDLGVGVQLAAHTLQGRRLVAGEVHAAG